MDHNISYHDLYETPDLTHSGMNCVFTQTLLRVLLSTPTAIDHHFPGCWWIVYINKCRYWSGSLQTISKSKLFEWFPQQRLSSLCGLLSLVATFEDIDQCSDLGQNRTSHWQSLRICEKVLVEKGTVVISVVWQGWLRQGIGEIGASLLVNIYVSHPELRKKHAK